MLIGLAWTEASAGDPARSDPLLAEATELVPDPDDVTVVEMANARLMATIRLGRFAECEAVAQRAADAIDRVLRPDFAYPVWINRRARSPAPATSTPRSAPPIAASRPPGACRWWRCPAWPRGRTCWPGSDATTRRPSTVAELLATAERLDSAPLLATARHDAGLVALAGGRLPRGGRAARRRARTATPR